MADLSGVSTKDLEYASRGQWDKVSTKGLEAMASARGMSTQEQPSVMAPVPYSPTAETVRAAAGGLAFQSADELEAAFRSGAISGPEYTKIRDQLRAQQGQFRQDMPGQALAADIGGSLALPLGVIAKPVTRGLGMIGDVLLGAGIGAGTGVGMAPTMQQAPEEAVKGGLMGGLFSGLVSGAGRLLAPNVRPEAAALREQGIPLTPGSAFGGRIQQIEQSAESIPLAGRIITGAREKQFEKFNTAAYNKVLSNLDPKLKVPSNVVGRDAFNYVEQQIQNQYENIVPNLRITYTPRVGQSFDAVVSKYSGTKLPKDLRDGFEKYVDGLKKDFSTTQVMNGRRAQAIKQDLGDMASAYSQETGANRLLGNAYRDLQGVYMNIMKNQNPAEANGLKKADAAYRDFVRVQTAIAKTRGEEGIFTPAQLEASVRQSDRSTRKGAFARGAAPMQDFSGTGVSVLGTKVPDSGTAGRGMTAAALTGGAGMVDPTMAALTGLSTLPYFGLGEKLMFAPRNPTFSEAVQRARAAAPFAIPGLLGLTQ
jgi:hypothetical protein